MNTFELRQVEYMLMQVLHIPKHAKKAFKARMRMFRDMGIPELPKVGKGSRAYFSMLDVWELHVAMALSGVHTPPRVILRAIKCLRIHKDDKGDILLLAFSGAGKFSLAVLCSRENMLKTVRHYAKDHDIIMVHLVSKERSVL
jgi:hypothetical protein